MDLEFNNTKEIEMAKKKTTTCPSVQEMMEWAAEIRTAKVREVFFDELFRTGFTEEEYWTILAFIAKLKASKKKKQEANLE
jgi:hypothetical protein